MNPPFEEVEETTVAKKLALVRAVVVLRCFYYIDISGFMLRCTITLCQIVIKDTLSGRSTSFFTCFYMLVAAAQCGVVHIFVYSQRF